MVLSRAVECNWRCRCELGLFSRGRGEKKLRTRSVCGAIPLGKEQSHAKAEGRPVIGV